MFRGRIADQAPTETIFTEARHPDTRSLLDAIPVHLVMVSERSATSLAA